MLRNFVHKIAGCGSSWTMAAFRDAEIARVREQVGGAKVICGLSGGVDSAVVAVLLHEAIGDALTCIFVDHGLLRQGEAEEVERLFRGAYNIPLIHVNARQRFLSALARRDRSRDRSGKPSGGCSSRCSTRRRTRWAARNFSRKARYTRT